MERTSTASYYVVIPAHNEEQFLVDTLESLIKQSLLPKKVVVVNDHSTDGTQKVIQKYTTHFPFITGTEKLSSDEHLPGSKVVAAFNEGLRLLDDKFDFVVKLDADTVLPTNYFQIIATEFSSSPRTGIAGGFAYEKDETGKWALNHPMDKDHVRGAFKAYSRPCFKAIGGLREAMGWDTVDELLARFHGFHVVTLEELKVKHQRPIGAAYNAKARRSQGRAMYLMRYGLAIAVIASLKMAWKNRRLRILRDNLGGYLEASRAKKPYIVTSEEGDFIRSLRWKRILGKLL
jgi:glycosyltransferase involved in cell wall biosynthesis